TLEPFGVIEDRLGMLDDESPAPELAALRPLQGPAGPGLVHLRQPPIVGRAKAQRALRAAADRAIDGLGPQVVIIEGEAGLGKSTLASWLREQVEESGTMRTLHVRSEPQTRQGGLRDALLRYIGAPSLTREQATAVFTRAFDDERNQRGALEALWPERGQESVEHRIKRSAWMIHDLSRERPFMLWCDDAHWSPEGRILQLALRLAREDGPRHMLIVITLRPTERQGTNGLLRSLRALDRCVSIKLPPVPVPELAEGLNRLAPLPPGIAEAAALQAGGNPLYALEAVCTHLESEGLGEPPTDPAQVLAQRVKQVCQGPLGGELCSLLARATLLGRAVSLVPLARLCRVPGDPSAPELSGSQPQTAALLERAVNDGLLTEAQPGLWRFSHDLLRAHLRDRCQALPNYMALNAACASLRRDRAEKDETGIELEVVARHHWEGGERALGMRQGLESVQRLHAAGLMGHATSFTRRLLEWDDRTQLLSAEDRCELRLLGSDAAEHAGQPFEAERHALAAGGRDEQRA
ncbi:MAG: AAA family ATPase, partial [Myxococcales bacterium]|nr:AAA family ATPase [Myxococcales bacterium]